MNLIPRRILVLSVLISVTFSCKNDDESQPPKEVAIDLPLLASGNKIGTIIGFNTSNPPSTTDSITARWNEAIGAGMPIGRLQVDWTELEPQPNTFDKVALQNQLQQLSGHDLQIFLTLAANDSEEAVVPTDLEGLKFDNGELITRFNKLMDWVIPMLIDHKGWIIAIANEPDNNYRDEPGLASEMLTFLKEVKTHIHGIDSRMAVTITQAEGNLDLGTPGMKEIVDASDVASWNFYGSNFDDLSHPQTTMEVQNELNELLLFSGKKNIVFQELGMHTGSELLNSSEDIQFDFFRTVIQKMEEEPRMRAAYIFQLVDWSPETTAIVMKVFEGEDLPQEFLDSYSESLNTIGLIRYQDGKRKLAWDEFIRWIEEFK